MGRAYQETTPAMMARVTAALDNRKGGVVGWEEATGGAVPANFRHGPVAVAVRRNGARRTMCH
jgi:hypothetical protein